MGDYNDQLLKIINELVNYYKDKIVMDNLAVWDCQKNELNINIEGKYNIYSLNKENQKNEDKPQVLFSISQAKYYSQNKEDEYLDDLINKSDMIILFEENPYITENVGNNQHWNKYWIEMFKNKGYIYSDELKKIFWNRVDVDETIYSNLMLFIKKDSEINKKYFKERINDDIICDVIHPEVLFRKCLADYEKNKDIINSLFINKQYDSIKILQNIKTPYIDYFVGKVFVVEEKYFQAMEKLNTFINDVKIASRMYDKNIVISAYYYLGLSCYNLSELEKAEEAFNVCMNMTDCNHKIAKDYLKKIYEEKI